MMARAKRSPGPKLRQTRLRGEAGRPTFFTPQTSMNVWLYVEFGRRRDVELGKSKKPMSALKFCSSRDNQLSWIMGGKRIETQKPSTSRPLVLHLAAGKSLLRRYQEAKVFLKSEGERYRMGVAGDISPTEEWWRRELKTRLDLLKK